jgi:hypothetical protein
MDITTDSNSTSTSQISSNLPEEWEDHRFIHPSDLKIVLKETHPSMDEEAQKMIHTQYTLLYPVLCKSFKNGIHTLHEYTVQYLNSIHIDVRNPPRVMHDLIELRKQKEKEKAEKKQAQEQETDQLDLTHYFYKPKSNEFLYQLAAMDLVTRAELIHHYTVNYKKFFSKKGTPGWVLSAGIDLYNENDIQIISNEGMNLLDELIADMQDDEE